MSQGGRGSSSPLQIPCGCHPASAQPRDLARSRPVGRDSCLRGEDPCLHEWSPPCPLAGSSRPESASCWGQSSPVAGPLLRLCARGFGLRPGLGNGSDIPWDPTRREAEGPPALHRLLETLVAQEQEGTLVITSKARGWVTGHPSGPRRRKGWQLRAGCSRRRGSERCF